VYVYKCTCRKKKEKNFPGEFHLVASLHTRRGIFFSFPFVLYTVSRHFLYSPMISNRRWHCHRVLLQMHSRTHRLCVRFFPSARLLFAVPSLLSSRLLQDRVPRSDDLAVRTDRLTAMTRLSSVSFVLRFREKKSDGANGGGGCIDRFVEFSRIDRRDAYRTATVHEFVDVRFYCVDVILLYVRNYIIDRRTRTAEKRTNLWADRRCQIESAGC